MNLRILLILACLLGFSYTGNGQTPDDSTATKRKWYAPDGVTLQFAGNIGMFAGGASYSFIHDKINAELLYGVVPKFDAEEVLHLLTARAIYKPFKKVPIAEKYSLTPLRIGFGLSYYFRDQVSTSWDSSYPTKDYYWWTSSLRITGAAGVALNRSISNSKIKEISLYSEIGTYDFIVTSAVKDPTLGAWDILSFSVGTRLGF